MGISSVTAGNRNQLEQIGFNLSKGGRITADQIQSIKQNGYDKWQLGAIWGRIKDFFCRTNVEEAREALSVVVDASRSMHDRVTSFERLQTLAGGPFQRNLTRVVARDVVHLSIRCGDEQIVDVTLDHANDARELRFAENELFAETPKLKVDELKNDVEKFVRWADKDLPRCECVIVTESDRRPFEASDESRMAFRKFLADKCPDSNFQKSMVSVLATQYSGAFLTTLEQFQHAPSGRIHLQDQSRSDPNSKVESRCGAVAVGSVCLLPPLSSGGARVTSP